MPVHVTKICCFDFVISNFRLVTSKMRYFEFRYLEFSRKIVYFSLRTSRKILRKFNDFSWKIRENKGRISTNFVCITFAQYCNGIRTFDHDNQTTFSKSIIQFYTDGNTGDITFQMQSYGTNYNNPDLYFLFYSTVVSGKQSSAFNHNLFDVNDVQLQNQILYFEDINLNQNKIIGLQDPIDENDAVNKKYVDSMEANHEGVILCNGSKSMTGDLNMANKYIINLSNPATGKDAANKACVDREINKSLLRDGSRKMTGDLNMDD